MRKYITLALVFCFGFAMAQPDSLGANARTRPLPRRIAPAYAEGQFIISNSALNGEWNDDISYDGTYVYINGDTVLVSPLPPGLGDGDNQYIDTIQLNGTILELSLANDNMPLSTVDLASLVGGGSYTFDVAGDSGTPETVDNAETLTISGGTGLSTVVSATNTVTVNWAAALEDLSNVTITTPSAAQVLTYNGSIWVNGTDQVDDADADASNELQTYGHAGTTSYTNTLSDGGGNFTLQASGATTISHTAGTVTISSTDTDTDTQLSQEQVQDFAWSVTGGTQTLITVTYQDGTNDVDFVVEPNLSNYTNDPGFITTEVDGSVSNELQTYGHAGTTSYTNTLSNGGGSFTLQAGTNVTLSHTAGTVTINAAGDGTGMSTWDLAGDSGTTQTVDEGETVTIAGGTNISTTAGATNSLTVNWAAALDDLSDVTAPTPSIGEVLEWNGSAWVPGTDDTGAGGTMTNWILAGDSGSPETINEGNTVTIIGGTGIATLVSATDDITVNWAADIEDLGNVVLSTPTSGQVLEFNGTNWVNATDDTGAGADDDWRFSAGTTWEDPAYREGLTSIFTTAATHGLRVDSTFQFNVEGGLATFDWQPGSGKSPDAGLFWEARGNTDGVGVSTLGGQNNLIIGASTGLATGHSLGAYGWAADDPNSPGTYKLGGFIKLISDKTWTAGAHGSIMEFHLSEANSTSLFHSMSLHSSGRMQLEQYGSFSDVNPAYLLGWSNTSHYIQKYDLGGTPGDGKVIKLQSGALAWADDTDTDTDTQLSQEQVQDFAWAVTGGTQTLISVTYQDGTNDVDFVVEPNLSNYTNDAGFLTSEVDGSVSNELQTYGHAGTTSYTNTLSDGGGSFILQASGIAAISHTAGTVTLSATEVDGSVSNELQTYGHAGTTSYTNTLSNGGGSFTLQAGTNVTLSHTAGTVTINASGGGGGGNAYSLADRDTTTQATHGFVQDSIPIPVYNDGDNANPTWVKASNSAEATLHDAYIVEVIDANTVAVQYSGFLNVPGGHGFTGQTDYFLGASGERKATLGASEINDWLFHCLDGDDLLLKDVRPYIPAAGGGGTNSNRFFDNVFQVKDDVDTTKVLELQLSGLTTATTRTLTIPDASGTIALLADIVDNSVSNELQTYGHAGTTSYTNTLSDGGGSFTLQASGIAAISHTAGTVTVSATEVDGSVSNELQTYGHAGTTSYTNTLSNGGGSFTLQAGTNVTLSHTAGTVTINATGGTSLTQEQVEDFAFDAARFGSGTRAGITVTYTDASNRVDFTVANASRMITGGADELNADQADIDWNPTYYTPSTAPTEATSIDHLTAHLYGIDQAIETLQPDAMGSQTSGTISLGSEKNYARVIDMTGLSSITITLNNPVSGGAYLIQFINADDGDTVTWPAGVVYETGTAPGTGILSDGRRMVQLVYYTGTTYYIPGGY